MGKVKFEVYLPGINELMKSSEMQSALLEAGQAVANAAGDEFEAEVHTANWIAASNVYATNEKAYFKNLHENTLLKALGSTGLKMRK